MDNQKDSAQVLCRDCVSWTVILGNSDFNNRCSHCGSPRILSHDELCSLSLAHIDCDAFYAAVEKRDNPELVDKPVIIGGGKRGVVSTACYIARIYGVRSAMPMFKALQLCPKATVLRPNMEKYSSVGKEIRTLMRELTPIVEPLSIDEAFLDLTGTDRLHHAPPVETLVRFALKIENELALTISIGLSYNKFLAKVASDLQKPRGFSVIGQNEAVEFLKDQPVSLIWGVGKAFQKKLARDGIKTIGQLQSMNESELIKNYGVLGQRLSHLARGEDSRMVSTTSSAKSVSSETTFKNDIANLNELKVILRRQCENLSRRLKKEGIAGQTIVLKLKTFDFRSLTRNRKLAEPTQLADQIFQIGQELLEKEVDGKKFRLLGIGVSGISNATDFDPISLIDHNAFKRALAERAVDKIHDKFGNQSVELGLTFEKRSGD